MRGRKGEYRKEIADYMKRGFQRLKIDGEFYEIADAPALDKKFKHDIEVVVDRIVVRPDMAARLAESFETALDLADGLAVAEFADKSEGEREPTRILFSSKFACPVSGFTIPEIEPRLFSFNNPFGACPVCGGLGSELRVDPTLVVPDAKADAEARRDRTLGQVEFPLLPADARVACEALQVPARQAVERVAGGSAAGDPARLRRGRDPLRL